MGDGLLAVFPIAEDHRNLRDVCGRVLEAAREARASVAMMEYPHQETIERFRFGVALHVGGILFGNIGGVSRLDFTCIGPAVNLAARMEKIAGRLGRTVVASDAFAGTCSGEWTDLGEFPIAGMAIPQRVYGLSDETPRELTLLAGRAFTAQSFLRFGGEQQGIALGAAGIGGTRRLGFGDILGEHGDDTDPAAMRRDHDLVGLLLGHAEFPLQDADHEVARGEIVIDQDDLVQARSFGLGPDLGFRFGDGVDHVAASWQQIPAILPSRASERNAQFSPTSLRRGYDAGRLRVAGAGDCPDPGAVAQQLTRRRATTNLNVNDTPPSRFAMPYLHVTIALYGRAAMRWCVSIGAVLVAGMLVGGDAAGVAAPKAGSQEDRALAEKADTSAVDVELVLAVDVSYSMDVDELAVQREGYAQAIVSKEFLQALRSLPKGRIAVTFFEWAAESDQKIIIPWRLIDGPETADAVASEILKAPIRRASRTSISGAINFAMPLFDGNPYHGARQVIDISGDGPNNNGDPVTSARDAALAKGITINGLPIMVKEPSYYSTMDIENLDFYYEDCVIGGPGAFTVAIKDRDKFKEAIRTKLLLEVAGRTPERKVVPVANPEPRVSCMIGEKIWKDRLGR